LTAEDMAQHAHAAQHDRGADPEPAVVVHARWMPEQPDGEDQHDDRQRESHAAEQPAERVVVEGDRHVLAGREPFHDRACDCEHDQQERDAVAALVLREGLLAEQSGGAADDVGQPHPGAGEQAGLLRGRVLRELLGRLGARARRVPRRPRT
jgi:hypothetical protein